MNFVEKLVEKLHENAMNQLQTKGVASYDISDIVKLCVAETAKEIKQKLAEWNNKPEDSSLCFQTNQICDDLISLNEVNHAE